MEDEASLPRLCPRCGKALASDAPEALCPACLLAAATETITHSMLDGALTATEHGSTIAGRTEMPRLADGQLDFPAPGVLYLAASPKQGYFPTPPNPLVGIVLTLSALGLGAIITIARPSRGPHDWLLGTWVVPR